MAGSDGYLRPVLVGSGDGWLLGVEMRKVECKEYEWTSGKRVVKGVIQGVFHQWGNDYEEFESGPGNYSVAIVELVGGVIQTFMPQDVRFIE